MGCYDSHDGPCAITTSDGKLVNQSDCSTVGVESSFCPNTEKLRIGVSPLLEGDVIAAAALSIVTPAKFNELLLVRSVHTLIVPYDSYLALIMFMVHLLHIGCVY